MYSALQYRDGDGRKTTSWLAPKRGPPSQLSRINEYGSHQKMMVRVFTRGRLFRASHESYLFMNGPVQSYIKTQNMTKDEKVKI